MRLTMRRAYSIIFIEANNRSAQRIGGKEMTSKKAVAIYNKVEEMVLNNRMIKGYTAPNSNLVKDIAVILESRVESKVSCSIIASEERRMQKAVAAQEYRQSMVEALNEYFKAAII